MTLNLAVASGIIFADNINQLVRVLQPTSGSSEVGNYYISFNSYTSSTLYLSDDVVMLARGVTPVSISVDTSLASPTNIGSPQIGHLVAGSVQIYGKCTSQQASNIHVGGVYTVFF